MRFGLLPNLLEGTSIGSGLCLRLLGPFMRSWGRGTLGIVRRDREIQGTWARIFQIHGEKRYVEAWSSLNILIYAKGIGCDALDSKRRLYGKNEWKQARQNRRRVIIKNRKDPITGLTELEWRFVWNFIQCPKRNASKAMRDAGYRVKRTDAHACRLLKKPSIKAEIEPFHPFPGVAVWRAHRKAPFTHLTPLEYAFVHRYVCSGNLNASKALHDAGSTSKSPDAHAARMLKNVHVGIMIRRILRQALAGL